MDSVARVQNRAANGDCMRAVKDGLVKARRKDMVGAGDVVGYWGDNRNRREAVDATGAPRRSEAFCLTPKGRLIEALLDNCLIQSSLQRPSPDIS